MSTSAKSKKNSKAIDRPFDKDILKQAKSFADQYQLVIWSEDGEFYGRGLELPLVMSGGKTPDQCVQNTREALIVAVAYMLEEGEKPPAPASDETRSVQLNIRLTASEKSLLEQAAQRNGFRGVSDYVRHAALTHGDN
jgi:predicted RNase H-like HicB family nuclease